MEITVNEQTTELKHKLDARSIGAKFTLHFCRAEIGCFAWVVLTTLWVGACYYHQGQP